MSSYTIALQFEDGVTRMIPCKPSELVSDAAYKVKINIPLDCRDGACGTCKCLCESGTYELGEYIEDAMTQDEAAARYVLTCKMRATSDCVLHVPASSHACKTRVESFAAKLTSVWRDSPTTVVFSLHTDERLQFLPGQYVNVQVPGTEESRSYSFSSAPGQSDSSFLIRDVPNGLMSTYMRNRANVGDAITFTGPYGTFYLRPTIRPILMLAGGTGLAPFLSMLRWLQDHPPLHPVRLAYGVNSNADLVELETLEALKATLPDFDYFSCVVDRTSGHPRLGYVTDHLAAEHLHDGEVDVYVCGPPPMVEGVRKWMGSAGITPKSFHYEKFSSANEAQAEKEAA
jgi:benzoate/toluate 1,2-dioxygenase reductase subunit